MLESKEQVVKNATTPKIISKKKIYLTLGNTKAGKSSFINSYLGLKGSKMAKTGTGNSVTTELKRYVKETT